MLLQQWRDLTGRATAGRGFALIVVLTLAVATAVTGTVAGIVDRVLVRPLPFANAEQVVGVWFSSPNFPGGLTRVRQSKATYLHIRDSSQALEHFALAEETALTFDSGNRAERLRGAQVTAGIFDVLGVDVGLGRRFTDADNQPGAEPTVIISDSIWRTRFGADPGAIGSVVRLDGIARRVVGILTRGVRFPAAQTELWVPLVIDPAKLGGQDFVFTGYGLRPPGVTPAALQADFARVIDRLPEAYPETFPRPLLNRLQLSGLFVPLLDEIIGPVRRPLLFALGATLLVLLTVLANLLILFGQRQERRRTEFAIRSAMGAAPWRLAVGVVAEALLYSLTGGLLGLAGAAVALGWVRGAAVGVLPRSNEIALDPWLAAGCVVVTAVLGGLVGVVTTRRGRAAAATALGTGERNGSAGTGAGLRWLLVGSQVALAVLTAAGAGALVRSVAALDAVDPGFRVEGLGGARLFLPATDYGEFASVSGFFTGLVDDLRAAPGVEGAAMVSYLPLRDGRILYPYRFELTAREDALPTPRQTKMVSDGYLETMRIPLLEGRTIERRDLEADTDAVVVNRSFAEAHWPGTSAIGKRLRSDTAGPWLEVVGVIGNERDRQLTDDPPPIVYLPYQARHAIDPRLREMSVVVRTAGGDHALTRIQEAVTHRDRAVAVSDPRAMTAVVASATARTRYAMRLVLFCASGAVFLAVLGLYAVLSESVTARFKEMAIRLAVGATAADLRRLVVTRAFYTFLAGGAAGLATTVLAARLAEGLLFGVNAAAPGTMAAVVAMVAAVVTLATIGPARRAAAIAPAVLLRTSQNG